MLFQMLDTPLDTLTLSPPYCSIGRRLILIAADSDAARHYAFSFAADDTPSRCYAIRYAYAIR